MSQQPRSRITLLTFIAWLLVTVLIGKLFNPGERSLVESVIHGPAWNIAAAGLLVWLVARWQGWHDLGFTRPDWRLSLRLCSLPLLYLGLGLGMSLLLGLPSPQALGWLLLNTLLIGFSEEIMFRGAILQASRHGLPIWPAIVVTSLTFGAVHTLNVFGTGDLAGALLQAFTASLSGLLFIALRLRLGSLWPCILLHAAWDFSTFTLSASHKVVSTAAAPSPSTQILLPVLLVLPNALYGLWLLRKITHQPAASNPAY